jgi:hypothetical protein
MEHFKTNKFPGTVSADSVLVSVIIPAYNEEGLLAASISRMREAFKSSRQLANAYEIVASCALSL